MLVNRQLNIPNVGSTTFRISFFWCVIIANTKEYCNNDSDRTNITVHKSHNVNNSALIETQISKKIYF